MEVVRRAWWVHGNVTLHTARENDGSVLRHAHLTTSPSPRMPSAAAAPRRALRRPSAAPATPMGRCASCLEAAARSPLVLPLLVVVPVVVVVVLGARLAEVVPSAALVGRLCAQHAPAWAS